MRVLYFYVASDASDDDPHVPDCWPQLQNLLRNKGKIVHALDHFDGGELETVDISFDGYHGLPKGIDYEDFIAGMANKAIDWYRKQTKTYDVLTLGQTPLAELTLCMIQALSRPTPFLVIRFSTYHGGTDSPYPTSLPPRDVGYDLDCPKDYLELLILLQYQNFRDAVAARNLEKVIQAVKYFNAWGHDIRSF